MIKDYHQSRTNSVPNVYDDDDDDDDSGDDEHSFLRLNSELPAAVFKL